MMQRNEKIFIAVLTLVYLLCSFRYYPGRPVESIYSTLEHFFRVSPFNVGITLLLTGLFQKLSGDRLSWDRVLRIFLTIGITTEFLFGLNDYLTRG